MASRSDDMGGAALVRQSSSSSCASQASSRSSLSNTLTAAATAVVNAPLFFPRSQLNFFMTRILFTQEGTADSLGARKTVGSRMNNSASNMNGSSSSSLNFNNSASRFDHRNNTNNTDSDGLLGSLIEADDEDRDICVFNDNARILPNSVAKSMPVIPFPPAAPESPRPVEGKDGIIMMEPTHRPASPNKRHDGDDLTMPEALPLTEMSLDDSQPELEDLDGDETEAMEDEDEEEVKPAAVEPAFKAKARRSVSESGTRRRTKSVNAVPLEQRVFPKNERRSIRRGSASAKKDAIKRSQSDVAPKDMSSSCH